MSLRLVTRGGESDKHNLRMADFFLADFRLDASMKAKSPHKFDASF
jgi:hypothetical protein